VLKEGEREKTKTYQAVVWVARPLTDADLQTLLAVLRASRVGVDHFSAHARARTRMHAQVKALEVHQLTPIRVLHRRTLLNRLVAPRASLGCSISVASQPA
jgi:tRNA U54 and U55 pseudouridine synthase Pus10